MLASEVCDLQKDLSNARRTVHQLIAMRDQMLRERDALVGLEKPWRSTIVVIVATGLHAATSTRQ